MSYETEARRLIGLLVASAASAVYFRRRSHGTGALPVPIPGLIDQGSPFPPPDPEPLALISRRTFDQLDTDHRYGKPELGNAHIGRDQLDGGERLFVRAWVVDAFPLFSPGDATMTADAEHHLREVGLEPTAALDTLLERHIGGDWGLTSMHEFQENDQALITGERIRSVYEVGGEICWLVSEPSPLPRRRPTTTLMLEPA